MIAIIFLLLSGCCRDEQADCHRHLDARACVSRCEGGDEQACLIAGNVAPTVEAKLVSLRKGCALGDPRCCFVLGVTTEDRAEALERLRQSCRERYAGGCFSLSQRLTDPAERLDALKQSCLHDTGISGHPLACKQYADEERDTAERDRVLGLACKASPGIACPASAAPSPSHS